MPPEPKTKLKRKSSRRELESEFKFDGGHARELEIKRSRGEVSCAECRRLKIKCDKQIPCTSCQRRGCAALCPNGSLATGQGTRFVLAATEHLHRRISKLSGRVRELEDALANLHGKHSTQPHPLLEEGLVDPVDDMDTSDEGSSRRKVKGGSGEDNNEGGTNNGEAIDAFGTLSISDHGISRFFGPTGGSESLLVSNLLSSENNSPTLSQRSKPGYRGSSSPLSYDRESSSMSPTSTQNSASFPTAGGTSSTTEAQSLALFSQAFPFTPLGLPPSEVMTLIESHLPPYDRALELVKVFFDQVSWLFRGLTQDQVETDMIPSIYKKDQGCGAGGGGDLDHGGMGQHHDRGRGAQDSNSRSQSLNRQRSASAERQTVEEWNGPHDLALLFIVFAIGSLVSSGQKDGGSPEQDLEKDDSQSTKPRHQVPAIVEHYHQLSRAALSLQSILEKPSIVTIQALHLLSVYNAMSGDGDDHDRSGKGETGMEMTWSLITLASHLSMTIGLHRDSARWGLTPKMVQRRRIVFWDLFVADVWTSLNTGRPPAFSLAYIDCSFPQSEEDNSGKGKEDELFGTWGFRFAAECVAEVSARTLTAEAPTYATIMELDRKVRDFPIPEPLTTTDKDSHGSEEELGLSFQKFVMEHIKETVLIYIHRSFFAQAIIEQPVNPLKSTYAPSFLAAYRASGTILKSVREQFSRFPNTAARFWTMWTFAFSAAVIFGTVVARGPRSPLASSAMIELDQACVLFSKAATYSRRAARALPILTKLREKARCALAKVRNSASPSGDSGGLLWNIKEEDTDDELSIFAGRTRFVSARQRTHGEGSSGANSPPDSVQFDGSGASRVNTGMGSIQIQGGSYPMDIAIDMDHPMEYDPTLRSSSYQMQSRPQQAQPPRQSYTSSHSQQPQLRLPQISNLGPYHSQSVSPSGTSPIGGWRPSEDSDNSDYAIPRGTQRYNEPTMIAIPPATPPPPPLSASSRQQRPLPPQQPPPQHRQSFTYSYDRDSRPSSNADYPWPDQSGPEPLSQVRLSHPQYMQNSNQIYHHSSSHTQQPHREDMYSSTVPSYHGYQHSHTQSHSVPSQHLPPPGNAALQGLGLASRDSRLDERWSSFMQDSGLLDDVGNYSAQGRGH